MSCCGWSKALKAAVSLIAVLAMASCAPDVKVRRVDGTPDTMTGVPYNLAMTTYAITINRHIVGCGKQIEGKIDVSIASSLAKDPSAMFTLYSDGVWSTSDLKATYATNGITTGLNTEVADVTGTVINDFVSTIASIAPLAFAFGAGGPGAEVCTPDTANAVRQIPVLKDTVDAGTAALTKTTADVTLLTAQVNALGPKADTNMRKQLSEALAKQAKQTGTLTADQTNLAKFVKQTTDTQTIKWPGKGSDRYAGPFNLTANDIINRLKWAQPGTVDDNLAAHFNVYLALELDPDSPQAPAKTTIDLVDYSKGIPTRFPAVGRLKVCDKPCSDENVQILEKLDGPVLQLGYVYTVPVNGSTFKDVVGALAFDPATAAPTTVEVTVKTASATSASGTLKSSASTIAGIPAAVNNAQLAAVKAKSDLLNAKTGLAQTEANNVDAAQLASLKAQSDLINAKITLATAMANGAKIGDLAPVQAQATLAQAQLALFNANSALTKAQASMNATAP